jgi:anti-sigma factor RsiW
VTPCRALRLQLAAYADDELGVDAAIEVERHLDECGACRREVGRQRHLMQGLRELYPAPEPPPEFTARVRFATLGPTPVRRTAAVATLAVVLLTGSMLAWLLGGATRPGHDADGGSTASRSIDDAAPAVAAAAAMHRRADAGELPLGVASADVATVNDWLHRHLPFRGSIADPDSSMIAVAGAAFVTLDQQPAGLVRYRINGRDVSLFLLAEPAWGDDAPPVRVGNVDFRVFQRRGLDLVGWSHAPLSYLLVSENGLSTGEACAACHGNNDRAAIADFVKVVAGRASGT